MDRHERVSYIMEHSEDILDALDKFQSVIEPEFEKVGITNYRLGMDVGYNSNHDEPNAAIRFLQPCVKKYACGDVIPEGLKGTREISEEAMKYGGIVEIGRNYILDVVGKAVNQIETNLPIFWTLTLMEDHETPNAYNQMPFLDYDLLKDLQKVRDGLLEEGRKDVENAKVIGKHGNNLPLY